MKKKQMYICGGIIVAIGIGMFFVVTSGDTPAISDIPPLAIPEQVSQETVSSTSVSESASKLPIPSEVSSRTPAFDVSAHVLPRATDIVVQDVDFEGDGIFEKVVYYNSLDDIGEQVYRSHIHLRVFAWQEGKWNVIKDDRGRVGVSELGMPHVIDMGSDGKQEMFAQKCTGRHCAPRYYVFGLWEGEYADWPIPKAYLNQDIYKEPGDTFIHLRKVERLPAGSGFLESYDVYCEEKLWGTASFGTDDAVCRHFEVSITYRDGAFAAQIVQPK